MTELINTQGLLLQSIPHLSQKKILRILTAEEGLISLFANKTTLTPFCLAEWVYKKSAREIHTLQDSTLLDPLLELRADYTTLSSAGSIAQDLLQTQLPGKKGPFALAYAYFKRLPSNPQILAASFKLRLLLHEGLFSNERDLSFSREEWDQVETLAFSRQFSPIEALTKAPFGKIEALFTARFNH